MKSTSGEKFATINPAYLSDTLELSQFSTRSDIHSNEQEISSVHAASAEDVDLAVEAARTALKDPSWKNLSSSNCERLLFKLADLVQVLPQDERS